MLLGDEGLGVHVARALGQEPLPPGVDVMDAGTALLDLLPALSRYRRVIIVDAIRGGGAPGTVYRAERLAGSMLLGDPARPLSLHDWGIAETLRAAETLGLLPEDLTAIGAEPESVAPSTELSPTLESAMERILDAVRAEIAAGGGAR